MTCDCPFCDSENQSSQVFKFRCSLCEGQYECLATGLDVRIVANPTPVGSTRILQKRLSEMTDIVELGLLHYMRVEAGHGSL